MFSCLFFHSRCFALDGEFYAVGSDLDESTFEQIAYGLLEHFLADTKHGVDFFGWRLVMIGRESLFGEFEVLEKTGGEVTNEDTTIGRGVVRCLLSVVRCLFRNRFLELFYLAGADDAVGFVVDVAIDLVAFASLHTHFLFAEGTEEVFHQAPIEVGTVFVGPGTFEVGKLPHFDEGMFSGGDEAFLLVEIEEDIEDVPHFGAFGHIAFGQQDVANVAPFEIEPVLFLTQDFQLIPLAQLQGYLWLAVRCLLFAVHCHTL